MVAGNGGSRTILIRRVGRVCFKMGEDGGESEGVDWNEDGNEEVDEEV